jgi:hypothetical protein
MRARCGGQYEDLFERGEDIGTYKTPAAAKRAVILTIFKKE